MQKDETPIPLRPLAEADQELNSWRQLQAMAQQLELQLDFFAKQPVAVRQPKDSLGKKWLRWLGFKKKVFPARSELSPSLLLDKPLALTPDEIQELKPLHALPQTGRPALDRDYMLAANAQGQLVSVFIEKQTGQYFLHGFFD